MAKTRFVSSDMPGAPTLTSNVGGAYTLLNTLLTSSTTAQSATAISVTSNIATVTTTPTHKLFPGMAVTITGSAVTAANGTWTILDVPSSKTFTFALTNANVSSTAAFTYNLPGMGWTASFATSPRLVVYSNQTTTTLRRYFVFDGSVAGALGVSIAQLAIDATNFTVEQSLPGFRSSTYNVNWSTSALGANVATPYVFFGDPDCGFYLMTWPGGDAFGANAKMYIGGAYVSANTGDNTGAIILSGDAGADSNEETPYYSSGLQFGAYIENNYAGLLYSAKCSLSAANVFRGAMYSGYHTGNANMLDGKLYCSNIGIFDKIGLRGWLPGILFINNNLLNTPGYGCVTPGYPGNPVGFVRSSLYSKLQATPKQYACVRAGPNATFLVNMDGTWR